jgi:hypothetical protein
MTEQGVIEPRRSLEGVRMAKVRQLWRQPEVADLPAEVHAQLEAAGALARIAPGDEIAITAGSRGIAAMPTVIKAIVEAVRGRGGRPFIFPAMGSHGGGNAEGQRELLAELGIDERSMGAPIRSDMAVVQLGESPSGLPVYLDANAARATGIILANRIKKHTNFDGEIESGLCKMAVIGMGKHRQAVAVHHHGSDGLRRYIPEVAACMFARAPILAGLGLVENARGGVAELHGLRPEEIVAREPALLARAKVLSPKIPFQQIDIGIVERLGKEISGTGMDCYVIGRKRIIGEDEWPEAPYIRSLVVLDVTPASHGNALGVGLADFTTQRLVDQIDWPALRANILTSGNMERGKIPLPYETDRGAIEAAAFRERAIACEALRIVAIRDTLHLEHLLVSEALLPEVRAHSDLEIEGDLAPLPFDAHGCWASPLT